MEIKNVFVLTNKIIHGKKIFRLLFTGAFLFIIMKL